MTTRIGAAIAAGFLAIGILVGAAGTIVIRDATASDHMADMAEMAGMMSMMGGGHMGDMMSMMGGLPMGPGSSIAPGASMMPDQHESHHGAPSPEATR